MKMKTSNPAGLLVLAAAIIFNASVEAADTAKWKTTGLQQANSMGGGEAAISKNGKFRGFVLMGQSNMTGAARAANLEPPYTQKHDRIRVWANGRWEYFVPTVRFGPGVSMARELADLWPNDTIGIIKAASGGTGAYAASRRTGRLNGPTSPSTGKRDRCTRT